MRIRVLAGKDLKFRIQGQICSEEIEALVSVDHNVLKRLKNRTLIRATKVIAVVKKIAKKIKEN